MQKYILHIVGGVVLIGILVGGWYVTQRPAIPDDMSYVLTSVADGTYTGEVPELIEPVYSDSVPADAQAFIAEKFAAIEDRIDVYPYDGAAWMELALTYYTAGDYTQAAQVWEFILDVSPTNATVLANLGRLNHFQLKEYEKAESYFLKAIEADSARADAYFELFDLYRYSYKKDTTAAVDIMKEGMEKFPNDINFPASLGSYFRDTWRPNQARAQFEKALQMAREREDMKLIESFTAELSRI